jgi:hypothetical protein
VKNEILFQETQKFNQWRLCIIFMGIVLIPLSLFNWGNNLVNQFTTDKIIPSSIAVGILVLFLSIKRFATITEDKITVSFFPFTKREFIGPVCNLHQ